MATVDLSLSSVIIKVFSSIKPAAFDLNKAVLSAAGLTCLTVSCQYDALPLFLTAVLILSGKGKVHFHLQMVVFEILHEAERLCVSIMAPSQNGKGIVTFRWRETERRQRR